MQLTCFGALTIISYIKPKQSTFNTAVNNALKVLKEYKDEMEKHGHSPRSADVGEASPIPECFKNLYDTYVEINLGATVVVTQSDKNHSIQKQVIGASPSIGTDTTNI